MSLIEIEKATQNNYTSTIRINKEDNIVEKIIDYGEYTHELFQREVYWLTKLACTGRVPKLLGYNIVTHTIVMEWCGDVLCDENKPADAYEQLFDIHIMLLKHGCFYNDWKCGNLLVKDGKITIIDFGWCPKIKEDYGCDNEVDSKLTEKPAGNYFKDIFEKKIFSQE
jgi:RIO-like serine/threonine protein kinase